jgi:geranylgeranylglycerol-phosphate geranylgeranyltransferase
LVREIIKDVQDLEGDRRVGIKTLPQVIGIHKTLSLALALFFVLVLLTYVPILAGWFGKYYTVITIYLIDLPLLALLIIVWGNPSPKMLRAGSVGLKAGMGLGIVALIVA